MLVYIWKHCTDIIQALGNCPGNCTVFIWMCVLHIIENKKNIGTVCPGGNDSFYIVSYYIKWVTTSWTYSIIEKIHHVDKKVFFLTFTYEPGSEGVKIDKIIENKSFVRAFELKRI